MRFLRKKEQKQLDYSPPSPRTPFEGSKQDNDILWSTTWGQLCDLFIQKEGRERFDKEYSTEMAKAYRKGILHVIPSSHDTLTSACLDHKQVISFVDTTKYWIRGYLTSQGPLRANQEMRITTSEFVEQLLFPPSMHSLLEWPPLSQSNKEREPILNKEGSPTFSIQLKFNCLSYKIFELNNEDQAKRCIEISFDRNKKSNLSLVEIVVKMLHDIEPKYIEQATGVVSMNGEKILISRRVVPRVYLELQGSDENKGGLALDYFMIWQHQNMLFSVFEPNVIRIWQKQERMAYGKNENVDYDPKVLKDALIIFQDNPLFKKGLTIVKYFVENKRFLLRAPD